MPEAVRRQIKFYTMNKLDSAFHELEALKSSEMGKVVGGFVSIEASFELNEAEKGKGKDQPVTNSGMFCGITINFC